MMTSLIRRLVLGLTLAAVALVPTSRVEGYAFLGYKWASSSVTYYVNPQSIYVSASAAVSAVQQAAAGWQEQSQANIQLVYGGTTNGSSLTLNGKNEVFFRNGSNGANIAETYYWWDGNGKLVDADIVFYEGTYRFYAFSGCSSGIYVEDVAIHEFGHVLGLNHSSQSGVTMSTAMPGYCDMSQLTLEPDDVAGIETLYPGGGSANAAPVVSIGTPSNNASYPDGTSITFTGSASDNEDGNVTASLRWTSSLAGDIGTGGSFTRTLGPGTHVVTATATDSSGTPGAKQVTLTITVPTGPTLSVRAYKVRGLQKADLSWSGLASPTVLVYRNGVPLITIANLGATTDAIDKKGSGSYTYKVCDVTTVSCSNQVTISF